MVSAFGGFCNTTSRYTIGKTVNHNGDHGDLVDGIVQIELRTGILFPINLGCVLPVLGNVHFRRQPDAFASGIPEPALL